MTQASGNYLGMEWGWGWGEDDQVLYLTDHSTCFHNSIEFILIF